MLTDSQKAAFEHLFAVLDATNSGELQEEDFVKLFQGDVISDALEDGARRLYLSLRIFSDTDKNRSVSKEEFLNWATDFAKEAAESKEISKKYHHFTDAIFAAITRNEDINVSRSEYANWFNAFSLKGDSDAVFAKLDSNGSGMMSKDEFAARVLEYVSGDATKPGYFLFGER